MNAEPTNKELQEETQEEITVEDLPLDESQLESITGGAEKSCSGDAKG